jgi:endonuclease/exonuclease/phosphatase family metal-dependent hydrolase
MSEARSLRVVTYNIHKCRGMDRRVRPDRIAEVLGEVDADVIALQEVWSQANGRPEDDQAEFIARALGLDYRFGENRQLLGGAYGNVVLSRLPIIFARNYDLSQSGREERGCLRADVQLNGQALHVYNVHLGTAFLERRHQARRLLDSQILTAEEVKHPRVLLGDFNEWTRGLASHLLEEHFKCADIRLHLKRKRTYPGVFPVLHLDHIYYDSHLELLACTLHRSRMALVASDHLPIVADFRLREAAMANHQNGTQVPYGLRESA